MKSAPPLGYLLVDVARLYRARIDRAFDQAGLGLTAGEARTLAYLDLEPCPRQSVLADRMNVEPMTVVAFLDRLEARGLVRREPDPRDRRAKIVTLAPEARPRLDAIKAIGAAAREAALAGVPEADCEAFFRVLEQVRDNVSQDVRMPDSRPRPPDGAATAGPRGAPMTDVTHD